MKNFLIGIIAFPTLCLFVITLLSFMGEYYYLFELLSHFRVQYLILFLLSIGFFIIFFNKKYLLISIAGFLINASIVSLIFFPNDSHVDTGTRSIPHQLSIAFANAYSANRKEQLLLNTITEKQPDLIVVQEINQRWTQSLRKLKGKYPYQKVIPREDNFGIGVYSKYPLENIQVHDLAGNNIPSISASILSGKTRVKLISTHPLPPLSQSAALQQKLHFKNLIKQIRLEDGHIVILGDLNTTLWSHRYKNLMRQTKLLNTRQGKGIYPSWSPGSYLGALLKLPLDHILTSKKMSTVHFETLRDVGSDHLPIFAKIEY